MNTKSVDTLFFQVLLYHETLEIGKSNQFTVKADFGFSKLIVEDVKSIWISVGNSNTIKLLL